MGIYLKKKVSYHTRVIRSWTEFGRHSGYCTIVVIYNHNLLERIKSGVWSSGMILA